MRSEGRADVNPQRAASNSLPTGKFRDIAGYSRLNAAARADLRRISLMANREISEA